MNMHLACVLSQQLVSVLLYIIVAVLTDTENFTNCWGHGGLDLLQNIKYTEKISNFTVSRIIVIIV